MKIKLTMLASFSRLLWVGFLCALQTTAPVFGQVTWPEDVSGPCTLSIDDVFESPNWTGADSLCPAEFSFLDETVEGACPQETLVNRLWTVTYCDSSDQHMQEIRLTDTSPPTLINDFGDGRFCASDLSSYYPFLVDDCTSQLTAQVLFQDSTSLCEEVIQFDIDINVADDCGNVLDTLYTVVLFNPSEADGSCDFSLCQGCKEPLACNYDASAAFEDESCVFAEMYFDCEGLLIPQSLCGDGTSFDPVSGTCLPVEGCAASESACGPNTVWDADLGLCIPETLQASCYFDVDLDGVVGTTDLLEFLSAYAQACN